MTRVVNEGMQQTNQPTKQTKHEISFEIPHLQNKRMKGQT